MTALTSERNPPMRAGDTRVEPVAAAVKVFKGSLVMRNAAGFLTKGATALNGIGLGRAEQTVDNSAGAAGAATVEYRRGVFPFANSGGGDLIAQGDVGKLCWIVDEQTVTGKLIAGAVALKYNDVVTLGDVALRRADARRAIIMFGRCPHGSRG